MSETVFVLFVQMVDYYSTRVYIYIYIYTQKNCISLTTGRLASVSTIKQSALAYPGVSWWKRNIPKKKLTTGRLARRPVVRKMGAALEFVLAYPGVSW